MSHLATVIAYGIPIAAPVASVHTANRPHQALPLLAPRTDPSPCSQSRRAGASVISLVRGPGDTGSHATPGVGALQPQQARAGANSAASSANCPQDPQHTPRNPPEAAWHDRGAAADETNTRRTRRSQNSGPPSPRASAGVRSSSMSWRQNFAQELLCNAAPQVRSTDPEGRRCQSSRSACRLSGLL